MIILLWVRVCRGTLASHCGLDVHKVASLPPEKSDPRHIGSSLRKRGILVAATPTGPGQSAAVATRPTNAQPAQTPASHSSHKTGDKPVVRAGLALPIL